jgi:hypothetical protein
MFSFLSRFVQQVSDGSIMFDTKAEGEMIDVKHTGAGAICPWHRPG